MYTDTHTHIHTHCSFAPVSKSHTIPLLMSHKHSIPRVRKKTAGEFIKKGESSKVATYLVYFLLLGLG